MSPALLATSGSVAQRAEKKKSPATPLREQPTNNEIPVGALHLIPEIHSAGKVHHYSTDIHHVKSRR